MNSIMVKATGPLACFSRPEVPVESVTYDVMTPSAARGLIECVYWKPEMRWIIEGIYVLKPIQTTSLMRNYIKNIIPQRNPKPVDVTAMRDQRNATILVDVGYIIKAHIEASELMKHQDIFLRRMSKGQFFRHPCLGCREFGVDFFELVNEVPAPPQELKGTLPLGVMLHSIDYANNERPLFFDAVLKDGYLEVPSADDTRRVR